ncbi:hypothetical protein [Limosilactobacillus reuteri]|uniref:hypothetical protein n=1 Tax=Limosilactobacillus reuteri TaxID=1598 RepID=UPI00081BEDFF|nr:hypothetical protein [Limosilactobacillus reuteri]OCW61559.1 hypothetical protein BBP11_02510 [Limosilactobacillus reuteri]OCW63108.1 hypothetical protein BBP10_06850 [Limosilactobacillus reuteri]OCW63309.1 hypothetical protein BBP12_07420 [Limosilactobacillus reuteri]OCW69034.1 hypothetical protein BBP13_06930 [Limosilactobacillus reuteri]
MELETQLNASDRNTRAIIGNNFQKIQEEDSKDDLAFEKFQKDTNARLDQLEQEKATRDELKNVQEAWKKKIEHVALGTDYETVEQAVMQILKEKGMI